MLAQGRNRPLEDWLSSLPKDIFENTPWLLYWMAACRLPFDPSKSQRHFEKAFERFKGQKDAAGIFLSWAGAVDSIFYAWEFKKFDKWFQVFEELMQTFKTFPSKEIEGRVASSMYAALLYTKPQHPEIETWAERALSLARNNKDIERQIQTLFHAISDATFRGGPPRAAPFIESLNELTKSSRVSPLGQITARMAQAIYHTLRGSHENCLEAVSEGLKLSRETGVHVMDILLLGNAASCALEVEDLKTAGNELGKMTALLDIVGPFEKSFYHLLKSREALIRNNLTLAAHHMKLASDFVGIAGRSFNMGLCWLREAMILHRLGNHHHANRLQKNILELARQIKSRLIESRALFIGAYFALDQGDETVGLNLLQKALVMAKELQYYFSADDDPSVTARLCATALETGIEVHHAQDIIRKRKLVLDDPPLHLENWPWAIQIYTLGRFNMFIDGKPFKSPKKTQKKPMEMLKVLSSFGEGQEVSKVQLSDILWPDAEGDKAQRSFDTTLYRLRLLLGHDKAIDLREGRLSIDLRYCWVDSMAFERILNQAKDSAKKEDRNSTIQTLEKAVSLYKGPFLAGETDEPWAISYNERLRSKFLHAIETLGNYLEEEGELNRAVDCFQKGIEVDDVAEVFYRRLMICLKHLGRRTDALSLYQRCEKTLSSSLGLEPSLETKAIKESLYE
jgi:DNA-binding SARP family transcriptional activator